LSIDGKSHLISSNRNDLRNNASQPSLLYSHSSQSFLSSTLAQASPISAPNPSLFLRRPHFTSIRTPPSTTPNVHRQIRSYTTTSPTTSPTLPSSRPFNPVTASIRTWFLSSHPTLYSLTGLLLGYCLGHYSSGTDLEKQALIQDTVRSSQYHLADFFWPLARNLFGDLTVGRRKIKKLRYENAYLRAVIWRLKIIVLRTHRRNYGRGKRYKKWVVMD
jgi:hypothetical protein